MKAVSRHPQTELCRYLVPYFNGGFVQSRVTGMVRGCEERTRVFTHTHPLTQATGQQLTALPGRHLSCMWSKGHVLLSGLAAIPGAQRRPLASLCLRQ